MHVFVTGGAGYIGSINVEQLLDAGHQVTVFDNLTEGHRLAIDPRAALIEGDLQIRCDIEDAMEKARPDAVMHFAASALVGESMQNPSKYFRNNVLAGTNLLDAMVGVGCRKFVFSSTCATFGIPDRVPIDESGECYKSSQEVIAAVVNAGLATVEYSLFPLASLKGDDGRRSSRFKKGKKHSSKHF